VNNGLQDRISIVQSDPNGPIMSDILPSPTTCDFTMCNPPFYSSREDVLRSAEAKESRPNAVCMGADVEMITAGGESAFVCRMVEESVQIGQRCKWYSSMLGKLSSLGEIVERLGELKIDNYAITEFVQGQTRRWAIAWSFSDVHLPDRLARISSPSTQALLPPRNTLRQTFQTTKSITELGEVILHTLSSIEGVHSESVLATEDNSTLGATCNIIARASRNTWSRAARRKKIGIPQDAPVYSDAQPRLLCRVRARRDGSSATQSEREPIVEFDWVQGTDRALFESFVSHVCRKVGPALSDTKP